MGKLWEAAQRHWIIALLATFCVLVGGLFGFLASVIAVWEHFSPNQRIPDFLAGKGWFLRGWHVLLWLGVMVAALGVLVAQIALLKEALQQRKAGEALDAEIAAHAKTKRDCGLERVQFLAGFRSQGQPAPSVTVRWLGHGPDYALVQKIETVFNEHVHWGDIKLDVSNSLRPDPKCKVVFVYDHSMVRLMGPISFGFMQGELLGVPVCHRSIKLEPENQLIVEVLPSVS